jgi:hypothetical protein
VSPVFFARISFKAVKLVKWIFGLNKEQIMDTSIFARNSALALLLLLTACGGGSASGTSGDNTSAINLIDWTWVGGSDTFGQPGDYGSKGVTLSSNMPQALEGAVSWTDVSGNLWMFAGGGGTGPTDFSDMWEFDNTNWTWMNGPSPAGTYNQQNSSGALDSFSSVYFPAARQYSAIWSEPNGSGGSNLWLFGGYVRTDYAGTTANANDLWKYDTSINQWALVQGSATTELPGVYGAGAYPGARWGAASWTDSAGNFWLFGGYGRDELSANSGYLNDLWKFDGTNWTWVSGAKVIDQPGTYNTPGSLVPGARSGTVSWADASGNLWFFGGVGYDSAGNLGTLNDLWKYNIASNTWTWEGGGNSIDRPGTYGTPGSPSISNIPGARRFAVSWKDSSDNFWLFGGSGYDSTGNFGTLNDLWKFDGVNWTWMSGSKIRDQSGEFGTTGNSDPARFVPGSRDVAVSWYDNSGRFWLFGGQGFDAYGGNGYLNDFWQFQPKP